MYFLSDEAFDREHYYAYVRRIHYDDRDAAMYENMLSFLWQYVIGGSLTSREAREDLYEEYTHWNLQYIDKVYYRKRDLPYRAVRRSYQSVIHLLDGNYQEGLRQLDSIDSRSFLYDGLAPKTIMTQQGEVYRPVSRLFILYNYDKYLDYTHRAEEQKAFRQKYEFAFRDFHDGKHTLHDRFLHWSLEEQSDKIFYPVFSRIYKLPQGPNDFFIYYREDKFFLMHQIM